MGNPSKKLRIAVIGCGFIGACHIDAIRRVGQAELVAVVDPDEPLRQRIVESYQVQGFADIDACLSSVEVDVVHNCTPHYLHKSVNERIIGAGKHVLCEKPLTTNSEDAEALLKKLKHNKSIVHCVNFNYRMYPIVQQMKEQCQNGSIGRVLAVHGNYLQDHLLNDTDYNWKCDIACTGPSRCVADIGSHWMDLAQTITGARITEVCAELATFYPVRYTQTPNGERAPVQIATEDYGAVLLRMDNGARGTFYVSNSSAGHKNDFHFEVDGTEHALQWKQETPNELWIGARGQPNQLLTRDPALLLGEARAAAWLPAGHPEGWADAIRRNIQQFYRFILDGKRIGEHPCSFATFEDGLQIIRLVEAILRSHAEGGWVRV